MPFHAFLECPKCGGGFTVFSDIDGTYSEVCTEDGTLIENFLTADASEFEDYEYDETDLVDRRFH